MNLKGDRKDNCGKKKEIRNAIFDKNGYEKIG